MKIGLFADSHYSTASVTHEVRMNSLALKRVEQAYEFFAQKGCDLVVCLGDLIDHEKSHGQECANLAEIGAVMRASGLKSVVVMGNHDAFSFTEDEFYAILGEEMRPRTVLTKNGALIFVDACYHQSGSHYAPPGGDWTDTFVPNLESLELELATAKGGVHVFMHQNADPTVRADHRIANAVELRTVLEDSGKVKAVYQGHFHPGSVTLHNGIEYITLPAVCEGEGRFGVIEI